MKVFWKDTKSGIFYRILGFVNGEDGNPTVKYINANRSGTIWEMECQLFFDGRFIQFTSSDEEVNTEHVNDR